MGGIKWLDKKTNSGTINNYMDTCEQTNNDNPRNSLKSWWASRDLNPGPDDYESVFSCLYRLILTYTVCYYLYNIRILKVKPVLLSDTEYQAEIRLMDTYMDTYYL